MLTKEIQSEEKEVLHKTLFFFMPQNIIFLKKDSADDENSAFLKSITPYFYWCSSHEFKDNEYENKFLFQYQIYFIEGKKIIPGNVFQKWYSKKNNIKIEIINFLDIWEDHEKVLLNDIEDKSNNLILNTNENVPFIENNNYKYFSSFAHFVGKSIFSLKDFYIKESEDKEFDILQKKYWQNMSNFYEKLVLEYYKNSSLKKPKKSKRPKKVIKKTKSKKQNLKNKNESN